MSTMEFDGKDLDDALAAASAATGRPASELDYQILEGGRKGVFGLGARPIRIRVAGVPVAPAAPVASPAAVPAVAPAVAAAPESKDAAAASAPAGALREII